MSDRAPDPTPYPHGNTICVGCHWCQPERFPNTSAGASSGSTLHGPLAETPDGDIHDYGDHPEHPDNRAAPALKHGDRVTITAPGHPWMNHSGLLLTSPLGSLNPWMVELDHGTRAGVMLTEVTRV